MNDHTRTIGDRRLQTPIPSPPSSVPSTGIACSCN